MGLYFKVAWAPRVKHDEATIRMTKGGEARGEMKTRRVKKGQKGAALGTDGTDVSDTKMKM